MSRFFLTILNMSLVAGYAALMIMIVRLLLKKAPKIFSYALWAVVLFRLLCPFTFESSLSLIPGKTAIPHDIVYSQTPAITTEIGMVDKTVNRAIQPYLPSVNAAAGNPMGIAIEIGSLIWILGIIAIMFYSTISYFRLKRRLSTATLVRDNIFETDIIQTPFVLGLIQPRIYIPTDLLGNELDYIIKHEQTHIRRRDYLIKFVAFLVLVLHWFNPVIWLSYFLMVKDMEMSCDESVMRQSSEDIRVNYSNSLLSFSAKQSGLLSLLAFGESNVKSRIKNVLNYKKPAFWGTIVTVVFVLPVALGLMTSPLDNDTYANGGDKAAVVSAVEGFGKKLQTVSLQAPKDMVAKSIQENYSEFVTQALIAEWFDEPLKAPGRATSSPWPERIEILSAERLSKDEYEVKGNIIEITSVEKVNGGAAAKRPITLVVKKIDERWLIDALTTGEYKNNPNGS